MLLKYLYEDLTTLKVLYYMPDHRDILQTYIWQAIDIGPRFPKATKFITYWRDHLDGPIKEVYLYNAKITNDSFRNAKEYLKF